jgi:pyruvate dehydrogenase E1 component alpha subunit
MAKEPVVKLPKPELIRLYRQMLLIRRFEEKTGEMYMAGKIGGFCHLYIGEEAVAVGAMSALREDDYALGAYRDHGHVLARATDPKKVMAELFGKATGLCKGRGGSMHMFNVEKRFFGGDGIVGGDMPVADGIGFAVNYRGGDQVVMCFFGDGAVNEGAFHESLNIASLWKLPIVFICENNEYGMGTAVKRVSAYADLSKRAEGYNLRIDKADGMDVLAVREVAERAVKKARAKEPSFIEVVTYRYRGHSMSDPDKYRTKEDVAKWEARDPIPAFAKRLVEDGVLKQAELDQIEKEIEQQVEEAVEFADQSEGLPPEALTDDVYA